MCLPADAHLLNSGLPPFTFPYPPFPSLPSLYPPFLLSLLIPSLLPSLLFSYLPFPSSPYHPFPPYILSFYSPFPSHTLPSTLPSQYTLPSLFLPSLLFYPPFPFIPHPPCHLYSPFLNLPSLPLPYLLDLYFRSLIFVRILCFVNFFFFYRQYCSRTKKINK